MHDYTPIQPIPESGLTATDRLLVAIGRSTLFRPGRPPMSKALQGELIAKAEAKREHRNSRNNADESCRLSGLARQKRDEKNRKARWDRRYA